MHIRLARSSDIPRIAALYDDAIAFQRAHGFPFWQDPDLGVVDADIAAGSQYLLVLDGQVAGIFSLCAPSALDEDLWQGRDPQAARYVNRIIVGRRWRGRSLFAPMLRWCEAEVRHLHLGLLRLDTWADSAPLIAHYARFGFTYVGERISSTRSALAPQYRGLRLAIMEKAVALTP